MLEDWKLRRTVKISLTVQLVIISLTWSLTYAVAYRSVYNIHFRYGGYRSNQPMPMNSQQIKAIVDYHNELRAGEGADNMELMTYNESLARLAENWAAQCVFTHPVKELNELNTGQNIFASTHRNRHPNPRWAIGKWFNEKSDYDYDTLTCAADKPCGHYTQLVWATTRSVGCAYHRCLPLNRTHYTTVAATYFVCYYWPGGNYEGAKPYTKGPACSKCSTGAGWCKDGLCHRQCSGPGEECSCAVICYNCATLDLDTCRCSCADGWRGKYCTLPCKDTSSLCNPGYPNRGWYPHHCNHERYQVHVRKICPAMCELCTEDPDAVANQCPPVHGTVLEEERGREKEMKSQPMPMTSRQIKTIVDYHNELRAGEGADNMELITYNESLARLAEDSAAQCVFTYSTLNEIGQNIYAATHRNRNPNPQSAIRSWFDKKVDYDYDTATCAAGKPCGVYTQIVWATTRSVGCAYHRCKPLHGTHFTEVAATYFVCYYWPGGKFYEGAKPYTKGPACSKCSTGAGWCTDGLCNRQCSGPGENCSCAAICYNCASVDLDTCRCSCADGWRGKYCTLPCNDTSVWCNPGYPKRGWYPYHCHDERYQVHVQNICPAMCELCTEDPDAVPGQCPPVNGIVLEEDRKKRLKEKQKKEKQSDLRPRFSRPET